MPDRKLAADPDTKAKSLLLRYPDDLSQTGFFGRFLTTLVTRYSRNNARRPNVDAVVDFIEVCNEPNYMWWPQQAPSADPANPYATSTITVADVVARMFQTAQSITAAYGGEPMLCGPGSSDTPTAAGCVPPTTASPSGCCRRCRRSRSFPARSSRGRTTTTPTSRTTRAPARRSRPQRPTPTRLTNRAADTRRRLTGRWAGWPAADPANPQILLTEGGVTLPNIGARWGSTDPTAQRAKQADLLQRNWNRMVTTTEGAGIAMLGYYLWYTDPNYDDGLCETFEAGGATRPAYKTWKVLPSFQ